MKNLILSIFFINILSAVLPQDTGQRLYAVRVITFSKVYEIYFTKIQCGYYRYSVNLGSDNLFMTYEGKDFYEQSRFDENFTIISSYLPMNIWTDDKGQLWILKKRFSPVIEKDRILKKYEYGYGENY
jgi:hypothetical protein